MKQIITILLFSLAIVNCTPEKKDNNNDVIGALALNNVLNPPATAGTIRFSAKLDGKNVECGSTTYRLPEGQTVQIRDFRLFVQEVRLVRFDGTENVVQMSNVDGYQVVQSGASVAQLDFTAVGSGACTGTSDNAATNTVIAGSFPSQTYRSVKLVIGVPPALNHVDPSAQPSSSPLRSATGMTWSWVTGYKFARLEFDAKGTASATGRMVLHLGSTNCSGNQAIAFGQDGAVTCRNSYRPEISVTPTTGFNPVTDTLEINATEIMRGVTATAFNDTTNLSCMPIGNGAAIGGTAATCGPVLRSLGLNPGTQAGFSTTVVNEAGVGTVNPNHTQTIITAVR